MSANMQVSFEWFLQKPVRVGHKIYRPMMPNPRFVPGLEAKIEKFERQNGLSLEGQFDYKSAQEVQQWFELENSTSFPRLFQRDLPRRVNVDAGHGHEIYHLEDKTDVANELRRQSTVMVAQFKTNGFRGTDKQPDTAASVAQVDLYANLLSALETQLVVLIQTVVPDGATCISVVCNDDVVEKSDEEAASGKDVASKRKRISID